MKLKLSEKQIRELALMEQDNISLEEKIVNFFRENPYPKDDVVHAFTDKEGIDHSVLKAKIYELVCTFLCGGVSYDKKVTEKEVAPEALKMGIDVEYEHTDKKSPFAEIIAKKIALDHLAETKDLKKNPYYTYLAELEKRIEKEDKEG